MKRVSSMIIREPKHDTYTFPCICENKMVPKEDKSDHRMFYLVCTVCKVTGFFYKGKIHYFFR